jgi:hypothetical protein
VACDSCTAPPAALLGRGPADTVGAGDEDTCCSAPGVAEGQPPESNNPPSTAAPDVRKG